MLSAFIFVNQMLVLRVTLFLEEEEDGPVVVSLPHPPHSPHRPGNKCKKAGCPESTGQNPQKASEKFIP